MFRYYDRYGLPAGPLALHCLLDREPADLERALSRELRSGPGAA